MREGILMFYIDAYMTDRGVLYTTRLDEFKEDASKFDEHETFELFRKFMTYLDDLGDDEVIIVGREFS